MWVLLAVLSAVTSGISVVLQKKGAVACRIYQVSAVNSLAMLLTVLAIALLTGSVGQLPNMPLSCWLLTVASGLMQAASWLFYFLAIKDANVGFLMVLDKANIILTMVLAWLLVNESITGWMLAGALLIIGGTLLMSDMAGGFRSLFRKENRWILWGIFSPCLQAVSNILAKLDTAPVSPVLTTALRLLVVAVVLCAISRYREGPLRQISVIGIQPLAYLVAGGIVLGVSYILMYQAIADGIAAVVTPIVRSGFLVSTLLARFMLNERLTTRGWLGFAVVFAGVLLFIM